MPKKSPDIEETGSFEVQELFNGFPRRRKLTPENTPLAEVLVDDQHQTKFTFVRDEQANPHPISWDISG